MSESGSIAGNKQHHAARDSCQTLNGCFGRDWLEWVVTSLAEKNRPSAPSLEQSLKATVRTSASRRPRTNDLASASPKLYLTPKATTVRGGFTTCQAGLGGSRRTPPATFISGSNRPAAKAVEHPGRLRISVGRFQSCGKWHPGAGRYPTCQTAPRFHHPPGHRARKTCKRHSHHQRGHESG
jgi:hypothetical protein